MLSDFPQEARAREPKPGQATARQQRLCCSDTQCRCANNETCAFGSATSFHWPFFTCECQCKRVRRGFGAQHEETLLARSCCSLGKAGQIYAVVGDVARISWGFWELNEDILYWTSWVARIGGSNVLDLVIKVTFPPGSCVYTSDHPLSDHSLLRFLNLNASAKLD